MTIFLVCLIILVWVMLSVGIAILINEMQFQRVKRKAREDLRESEEVLRNRKTDGLRRTGTKEYESGEEFGVRDKGEKPTGVEFWEWIEKK